MGRYLLTFDEAKVRGLDPYAVYGGKVYSLRVASEKAPGYEIVPHGSPAYEALASPSPAKGEG